MGVGDGFDEELMDTIFDHGGGNFYYIDTHERIPVILLKELEGVLSVVANRMTLTIRQSGGARVTSRNISSFGDDKPRALRAECPCALRCHGAHSFLFDSKLHPPVTGGFVPPLAFCEL